MMKDWPFIDYTKKYRSIMQFDKNKNVFVHRWYPFVEGYSKEFIEDIICELPFTPVCALEPFCGSGTTPVELQNHNIKCYSFEVSPFMHLLSKVKLRRSYKVKNFVDYAKNIIDALSQANDNIREIEPLPFGNTIVKTDKTRKWNFHDEAIDGLLDIRHAIRTVVDNEVYKDLFTIALSSIIVHFSNLFRNGKCLSYRKGWQNRKFHRDDVHKLFIEKLNSIFADDIQIISNEKSNVHNAETCFLGDVRKNISIVPDDGIDLVVTSPPYLNSRDYTDIYMLELKVLQLVNSYEELRKLRMETLRSHVQVKYDELKPLKNERLQACLVEMSSKNVISWNHNIHNMICAYFDDMQLLFSAFAKKMRKGGVVYFNVANSAYYGVEVPVDSIIADIAETCGFTIREIRMAREIKTSPQQSKAIGKLRESVIVLDY